MTILFIGCGFGCSCYNISALRTEKMYINCGHDTIDRFLQATIRILALPILKTLTDFSENIKENNLRIF